MSKLPAEQSSADTEFWALVDARAQLMGERAALCHADGRPRGFAVLSWESPARRRASALAARLAEMDPRFEQARAHYAASMRVRAAADVAAMCAVTAGQVEAVAGRPSGEFSALRVRARTMAAMDLDDAWALRALEQKIQSASRGKR